MARININRKNRGWFSSAWMMFCLVFVIILPFVIGVFLYMKSKMLFVDYSFTDILLNSEWKPLKHKFGLLPFIVSSLWVSVLALLIAVPICLFSAINLTYYANNYIRKIMRPVMDILAGIPSVIYGVWGIIIIVPFVSGVLAPMFGKSISGYCILSGSLVLAVMIIPFILNIMLDVFNTIPFQLMESSLSLGATKWQTIKYVMLKKALPGIVSACGLGLSRAFGETIAVLMIVGNVVKLPTGVFSPGYPIPALIANNYGEMMSIPLYDSALMFAAFILLIIVLLFNLMSRIMIIRFEKHI